MRLFFSISVCLTLLSSCSKTIKDIGNTDYKIDSILNHIKPNTFLNENYSTTTIQNLMQSHNVPGLRIVFVDRGNISWSRNYGYANLEDSTKVDNFTVFTGASLGKPITSMASLKLVEKGVLNLDDDVNNTLKGWKVPLNQYTKKEKVTLRRLIGHTSGFNRYYGPNYMPYEKLPTIEQTLKGEKPSKHPPARMVAIPGAKYIYSNPGYLILEKLLEDATNQKFEDLMIDLVFKPCKMNSSSFLQPIPSELSVKRAIGYSKNLQPQPYNLISFTAAGGIWTTPNDLARFTGQLLKDYHQGSQVLISQKMSKQVFNRGGNLEKLGFTMINWNQNTDDLIFRHTGQNYGFTSVIVGSIKHQQALVIMANGVDTQYVFNAIQRAVAEEYNWGYFKPTGYDIYDAKDISFSEYAGQYNWKNNFTVITNEYKDLFIQINNERHQLIPVDERMFLAKDISLLVIFPKKPGEAIAFIDKNGDYSRANKTY